MCLKKFDQYLYIDLLMTKNNTFPQFFFSHTLINSHKPYKLFTLSISHCLHISICRIQLIIRLRHDPKIIVFELKSRSRLITFSLLSLSLSHSFSVNSLPWLSSLSMKHYVLLLVVWPICGWLVYMLKILLAIDTLRY